MRLPPSPSSHSGLCSQMCLIAVVHQPWGSSSGGASMSEESRDFKGHQDVCWFCSPLLRYTCALLGVVTTLTFSWCPLLGFEIFASRPIHYVDMFPLNQLLLFCPSLGWLSWWQSLFLPDVPKQLELSLLLCQCLSCWLFPLYFYSGVFLV